MPVGVSLEYKVHVQNIGWQDWVKDGELAGTTGKGLRIEAIKIRLVNSEQYSVVYNAHVQDIGWQGWANDGETAGTTGKNLRIEAIQIKVEKKSDEVKSKIYIDNPSTYVRQEKVNISGWAITNADNTSLKVMIDDTEVTNIVREKRQDVLEACKGYGGEEKNPTPGFKANIDFSKYSLGNHTMKVQIISATGKILTENLKQFEVKENMKLEEGIYGKTGLAIKGDSRGTNLKYYKYGNGPNVFFATFAVHGFEDHYAKDGKELTIIAENFKNKLVSLKDENIYNKWTIYIFPQVNPDGAEYGTTNNGPGRTTLYSAAPGNKGIDINRCWHISGTTYKTYTDSRNYNGTEGFQSYEARALRDFLLAKRATKGQTILVDLHGWTTQVIGDREISLNYYGPQFYGSSDNALNYYTSTYGQGYLINWARSTLGYNGIAARSALIELPQYGANGKIMDHANVVASRI